MLFSTCGRTLLAFSAAVANTIFLERRRRQVLLSLESLSMLACGSLQLRINSFPFGRVSSQYPAVRFPLDR